MTTCLGLLAVLQVICLPGAALLAMFEGIPLARRIVWSFAISMLANCLIVFFLIACSAYTQSTMSILVVIEVGAIAWACWRRPLNSIPWLMLFFIACVAMLWFLTMEVMRKGSIFVGMDELVSWNKWALTLASGQMPRSTYFYGQLLPALFSVPYVFTAQTKIQFFSKAIMPIFSFFIIFNAMDLALTMRRWGYWLAGFFQILIVFVSWRQFPSITAGLADIPLACLAILTFSPLFLLVESKVRSDLTVLYLRASSCFLAATILCKQAGIWVFLIYGLALIVFRDKLQLPKIPSRLKLWSRLFALPLGCLILWYSWCLYWIGHGENISDIRFEKSGMPNVLGVMRDIQLLDRWTNAGVILKAYLGGFPGLFICLIGLLGSLRNRLARFVVLAFILPYAFLWASVWSYDIRNFCVVFPFLATVCGVGLQEWIHIDMKPPVWFQTLVTRLRGINPYGWVLPSILFGLFFAVYGGIIKKYDENFLQSEQLARQRVYVGDLPDINAMIAKMQQETGPLRGVATNYPFFLFFPDVEVDSIITEATDIFASKYIIRVGGAFKQKLPTALWTRIDEALQSGQLKQLARSENAEVYLNLSYRY